METKKKSLSWQSRGCGFMLLTLMTNISGLCFKSSSQTGLLWYLELLPVTLSPFLCFQLRISKEIKHPSAHSGGFHYLWTAPSPSLPRAFPDVPRCLWSNNKALGPSGRCPHFPGHCFLRFKTYPRSCWAEGQASSNSLMCQDLSTRQDTLNVWLLWVKRLTGY